MGEASSDWKRVTSGVPQGSVLGPILFILYINEIVDNLETIAKIYANDTKLIAIIAIKELDALMLQSDLFKIHSWTREWLILLNIDKCKIMHLGRRNTAFNYTINNGSSIQSLHKTTAERDLGVIMTSDLKSSQQVAASCSKANIALGRLRHFSNFTIRSSRLLYTSLVRPHLEYDFILFIEVKQRLVSFPVKDDKLRFEF